MFLLFQLFSEFGMILGQGTAEKFMDRWKGIVPKIVEIAKEKTSNKAIATVIGDKKRKV